ncbi:hypothetical protein JOE48_003355 [Methylobacterium sp. PvR107]|nr:hypothetical protein [Methylobacterium sp. PvR107]
MPSKRSKAQRAATGRTWSPVKGLTLTERGPRQVQARVRRTGWPSQTQTFETVGSAEAWGTGARSGDVRRKGRRRAVAEASGEAATGQGSAG